jgi:adenosylmethionine-8-amino-7-oxononanoate aminotransferase
MPESCSLDCACALEREIQVQGPETVSAFIAEPYSGNSLCGAHPQKPGYFQKIREICDKYNVLMIMDEVMTGVGRTGDWFAYQGYGVVPDIVTMGKALGGGYFPVGGVGCSAKVSDVIENNSATFAPGFSWAGNPMAGAVISATIDYKIRHELLENVQRMGDYLMKELRTLASAHPSIGDVRGKGLLIGIEFVKSKETKEPFDPTIQYQSLLVDACRKNGMFIQSGSGNIDGILGDMLLLGPAYTIRKSEIDDIIDRLDLSLSIVEKQPGIFD